MSGSPGLRDQRTSLPQKCGYALICEDGRSLNAVGGGKGIQASYRYFEIGIRRTCATFTVENYYCRRLDNRHSIQNRCERYSRLRFRRGVDKAAQLATLIGVAAGISLDFHRRAARHGRLSTLLGLHGVAVRGRGQDAGVPATAGGRVHI